MPGTKRLTREIVIQTAADLADCEGLAQLTLARLAVVLGVRASTISHHVERLDLLRQELGVLASQQLNVRLQRAAAGKAGDDAVIAVFHAYRAYVHEHPGIFAAVTEEPWSMHPRRVASRTEYYELLDNVFAGFGLDKRNTWLAVQAFASVVLGFVRMEEHCENDLSTTTPTFDWAVRLFIDGLRARSHALQFPPEIATAS